MDRTNSGSIDISVHMHKLKESEVVHCVLLLRLHVKIGNFALFLKSEGCYLVFLWFIPPSTCRWFLTVRQVVIALLRFLLGQLLVDAIVVGGSGHIADDTQGHRKAVFVAHHG